MGCCLVSGGRSAALGFWTIQATKPPPPEVVRQLQSSLPTPRAISVPAKTEISAERSSNSCCRRNRLILPRRRHRRRNLRLRRPSYLINITSRYCRPCIVIRIRRETFCRRREWKAPVQPEVHRGCRRFRQAVPAACCRRCRRGITCLRLLPPPPLP